MSNGSECGIIIALHAIQADDSACCHICGKEMEREAENEGIQ